MWIAFIEENNTHRVVTLMGRVHRLMRMMTAQLDLLETMSPKEYQQIRLQARQRQRPGITRLQVPAAHAAGSLAGLQGSLPRRTGLTVEDVYDGKYDHGDSYVVAEALVEFDELFQKFRANHIYLIQRSIGLGSKSLKGRPVDLLQSGARHRFFPDLWDIRADMTDRWGSQYGVVRDSHFQTRRRRGIEFAAPPDQPSRCIVRRNAFSVSALTWCSIPSASIRAVSALTPSQRRNASTVW